MRRILILLLCTLPAVCSLCGQTLDLDALLTQAQTEQATGHYAEAAKDYALATKVDPTIPELWANRGVMEFLSGQADASIPSLKRALSLNPKLLTPMLFLGKAYIQSDKPESAIVYLNQAHAIKPNDIEVLLSMGKANQALHQAHESAIAYAEATRIDQRSAAAWYGLGVSSLSVIEMDGRQLATKKKESVWASALYADALFAQGRPVEAREVYSTAIASANAKQKAILATTLEMMGKHPDEFPVPSVSLKALKNLRTELTVQQGTMTQPGCTDTKPTKATGLAGFNTLAACAFWEGNYERSAIEAAKVLDLTATGKKSSRMDEDAEALYWSVKANERGAVIALARFEELAPHSPATYDLVGDLYRHQREPDSAVSEYKKALAIDPHDAEAQLSIAALSLSLNTPEESASIIQNALTDRPQDPQLNLLMAESFVARQQFAEAAPYLDKSLSVTPELLLRVHALYGRVDAEAGKTEEAILHLQLALSSDEDGSLHYQISRLYRKTGHIAEAQRAEAAAKLLSHQRLANAAIALREAPAQNP